MKDKNVLFLCCGASGLLFEEKKENDYKFRSGLNTEKITYAQKNSLRE